MSTRPWFSDQAAPARKRRNFDFEASLDADIDHAWRKAAYEAMERVLKNHYSPKLPAAARRHGPRSKLSYGGR